MPTNFQRTQEFHVGIGDTYPTKPTLPSPDLLDFREKLIDEEYAEVKEAIAELRQRTTDRACEVSVLDLTHLASELVDLIYVTYGGLAALGVDADAVFAAIHEANMRKLDGPKREDGKQLKPEGWQPADIKALIAASL